MSSNLFTILRQQVAEIICPEMAEERRQLERAANYDELTGLASRRAFNLARAAAESDPYVDVILFDGNNFGLVNKQLGHEEGDHVLKDMAEAIAQAADLHGLRERCFRVGGDEFVVLAPRQAAENIRWYAEQLFGCRVMAGTPVSISGTIGSTLDDADRTLQRRKRIRKASGK